MLAGPTMLRKLRSSLSRLGLGFPGQRFVASPPDAGPAETGSLGASSAPPHRLPTIVEWAAVLLLALRFALWLKEQDGLLDPTEFADFTNFYAGGWNLLHGRSPYDHAGTLRLDPKPDGFYVSPPWFALLMLPFAALPYSLAARLWLGLLLGLLVATVTLAGRLSGLRLGWRRVVLLSLALTLWLPVEDNLRNGQCSLLVSTSALAATLAVKQRRLGLAGGLLALASIKPQLVFLLGLGLALWSWRRERSLALVLTAGGLVGLGLLIVTAVAPTWIVDVRGGRIQTVDYWATTVTVRTLLATLDGPTPLTEALAVLILLAGSAVVLIRWTRPDRDLAELTGLTLALTLLITPYAYHYDYLMLMLPLLLVAGRLGQAGRWRRLVLLAVLVIGCWSIVIADVWLREWLSEWWNQAELLLGPDGVDNLWDALDYFAYGRFTALLIPLTLVVWLWRVEASEPPRSLR
jgi:glycosyl transferase family 87